MTPRRCRLAAAVARRRTLADDRGQTSIEVAILAPVIIALLLLMIAFGRVTGADGAVDAAARAAARAASLERDANSAQASAASAASASLTGEGVTCRATSVRVDTSGYSLDVGQEATITADLSCVADLSDIGLPGLPGAKTFTASWTSPLDTYRGRS